jgi:hypothetical protein
MDSDLVTRILYWAGFVLRLVLLLPLLAGLLILSTGISPSSQTLEQFRSAVLAGDVDQVTYRASGSGELKFLTWSESPLVRHDLESAMADAKGPYTAARLTADVRRAPNRPSLTQEASKSDANGILPDWPFDVRGGWWIAASWMLVFLTMLFTSPRLANRWAWFWLFTVGQVGAVLYLVLEPRPLWQGPGEGLTRDKRVDGGSGCAYSIILGIVSGLAALGIGRLVKLVLG